MNATIKIASAALLASASLLLAAGQQDAEALKAAAREIHDARKALADAAQAQRDLEARKTTGSTVLTV